MQKSILATALVAMTVTFNGVANAITVDMTKTYKATFANIYKTLDAALERKDVNQYYSYFAPEYTRVGLDEKIVNLKVERQQVKEFLQKASQIKADSQIKKITGSGQTVTVVGVINLKAIITDPQSPQVTKPYSTESTFQETWKSTNSGWKLLISRTLSLKNTDTGVANQGNNGRNYLQALNLADIAINKCYEEKDLVECDRLRQIQTNLLIWCQQDDQAACAAYNAVQSNESQKAIIQSIGD